MERVKQQRVLLEERVLLERILLERVLLEEPVMRVLQEPVMRVLRVERAMRAMRVLQEPVMRAMRVLQEPVMRVLLLELREGRLDQLSCSQAPPHRPSLRGEAAGRRWETCSGRRRTCWPCRTTRSRFRR